VQRFGISATMLKGSVALVVAVGLNALGGLVFWLAAARELDQEVVGRSTALFQSQLLLTYVAGLGLPLAIARFAADVDGDGAAVSAWAMRVRSVAALSSGTAFVVVLRTSDLMGPLRSLPTIAAAALYVGIGIGMALATLVEMRLVALCRWRLVVVRAALPVAVRLIAFQVVVQEGIVGNEALVLFLLAAVPVALSGLIGAVALALTADRPIQLWPRPRHKAQIRRFALVGWVGALATDGPVFAVPFIVALSVESAENAAFYVAWSFGAIAFVVPQLVSSVVLTEGARTGAVHAPSISGLRLALLATMLASVVAQGAASSLARLYGDGYGLIGEQLPLLVGATICWSYTSLGLAAARLRDRDRDQVLISTVFCLATVVPTAVLTPRYGSAGATWSWLAGNAIAAVVTGLYYLRWRMDPAMSSSAAASPVAEVLAP
jgi:O-antigen/teichoic acid export membrane protein